MGIEIRQEDAGDVLDLCMVSLSAVEDAACRKSINRSRALTTVSSLNKALVILTRNIEFEHTKVCISHLPRAAN